jgi:hypothetical protein
MPSWASCKCVQLDNPMLFASLKKRVSAAAPKSGAAIVKVGTCCCRVQKQAQRTSKIDFVRKDWRWCEEMVQALKMWAHLVYFLLWELNTKSRRCHNNNLEGFLDFICCRNSVRIYLGTKYCHNLIPLSFSVERGFSFPFLFPTKKSDLT